jgi:LmbE family N-acetylglucosaminyl deacetylase
MISTSYCILMSDMEKTSRIKLLVIAAHPDDEILGAYSYLSNSNFQSLTVFVCEGSSARFQFGEESTLKDLAVREREQAAIAAAQRLGNQHPVFLNFPNFSLSSKSILEINKKIEEVVNSFEPEIVITHDTFCNNLDHSTVSIAVSNLLRTNVYPAIKTLLHMEIPSSTEQTTNLSFHPNHFIILNSEQVDQKISTLSLYGAELQRNPGPRSDYGIRAYAAFRGITAGTFFAESFRIVRSIKEHGGIL